MATRETDPRITRVPRPNGSAQPPHEPGDLMAVEEQARTAVWVPAVPRRPRSAPPAPSGAGYHGQVERLVAELDTAETGHEARQLLAQLRQLDERAWRRAR